jgi:hypothetical protein
VWALTLRPTPAWTQLTPAGTPPPARRASAAVYDPVRDQMVVWGGRSLGTFYGDTWVLSLAGATAWTQLTPAQHPDIRSYHAMCYDPVRDRVLMFGGHNGDQYNDLWELTLNGTPVWTQLAPGGETTPARQDHSMIYDPLRDRLLPFGGKFALADYSSETWEADFQSPLAPAPDCPAPAVVAPGTSAPVAYPIHNPYGFAQPASYALTCDRDWPGFPITGALVLAGGANTTVPISIPVPDTAAAGSMGVHFSYLLHTIPVRTQCDHTLIAAVTATLASLVSADAEPDHVRLVWDAPDGTWLGITLERRDDARDWQAIARLDRGGDGRIVYDDRDVVAGQRYAYRLAMTSGTGVERTAESWVTIPVHEGLSLAGAASSPTHGTLSLSFALPDGAPATLELLDLAGRRIWSQRVGALGAGAHVVRVDAAAPLASGIYLARLARGSQALTAKVAVIR